MEQAECLFQQKKDIACDDWACGEGIPSETNETFKKTTNPVLRQSGNHIKIITEHPKLEYRLDPKTDKIYKE